MKTREDFKSQEAFDIYLKNKKCFKEKLIETSLHALLSRQTAVRYHYYAAINAIKCADAIIVELEKENHFDPIR